MSVFPTCIFTYFLEKGVRNRVTVILLAIAHIGLSSRWISSFIFLIRENNLKTSSLIVTLTALYHNYFFMGLCHSWGGEPLIRRNLVLSMFNFLVPNLVLSIQPVSIEMNVDVENTLFGISQWKSTWVYNVLNYLKR